MSTPTTQELLEERADLLRQLQETRDALRALRAGEVDAVVVADEDERVCMLEPSDQTYRLLVEQLPHGAATLTEDGLLLSCNRRFSALLDQPPQRILGRAMRDFVDAGSRARLDALLRDCRTAPTRGEIELQPRLGEPQCLYVGLSAVQEGALGTCLVLEDLTELKYLQDLETTQQALFAADRRKDEFLATLAHELRNPLAPIRNALEVLKLEASSPARRAWSLGVLDRQVQLMSRLLDDLLDITRMSLNKLELRKERVELATVLEAALETSRPVLEAAGHALDVDLPVEPVALDADPVRLAQVFANLLNNAAKYTQEHGRAWLSARRRGHEVNVSIRDDGIGIAPEMLPHLFEIFSQAKSALGRSQDGLGIGLSLARGILHLHGGTIEARSDGLGRGSEFIVRLPVATGPSTPERVQSSEEVAPPGASGMRILVVDDNRDNADTMAKVLELSGNEVATAYDGERALELAHAWRPQAVVLDLRMPGLDGYDVCRRMRENAWGQSMCLVALTGWGQEEDRRKSDEAGFDHHMVKPVDCTQLLELLDSWRTRRQARGTAPPPASCTSPVA